MTLNTGILVFRYEMRFKSFRPKRVKKVKQKMCLVLCLEPKRCFYSVYMYMYFA